MVLISVLTEEYRPSADVESLLLGVAGGDQEALARLYEQTRASVYALALSYLRSSTEAEDVAQDVFVRIWENAPGYRPQGHPMAWIMTIARNLALMRLRARGKLVELSEEEWVALPESPSLTSEDRQVLQAALNALTSEERQIVTLHAVAGLKHREIAQLLELPLATVLSKYHRALKKLRILLKGED